MFNSITWGQYFTIMTLLIFFYYAVIGVRYFRWEILSLIGINKVEDRSIRITGLSAFRNPVNTGNHENYLPKPALEIDISPLVQSFIDEVLAYFQSVDHNKIQKSELLNSLQLIAAKYPALKDTDSRDELEQSVLREANLIRPNLLQPFDVNRLWN